MKIKQIETTAAFAWSSDGIPLLATGSIADTVDFDAPSTALLQIWNAVGLPQEGPVFSAELEHKFHALAWLRPLEGRPRGILVGAFANGTIEFWDVDVLFRSTSLAAASIHKHTGENVVKCMQFSPHLPHVLATGGVNAQILIWDVTTFAQPVPAGKPLSPMDNITSLAWNNVHGFILASTSSLGYTIIWDLKKEKEVMHLLYVGASGKADFSHVAWHPTELTKLATASQSDTCPLIMTWSLRTPQEPESIMHGHTKGVLSLDWCMQDPNLLISAGKDNCARLWNPVLGIKLGDYPTTANWAFLTRFAPRAPDIFATASFDGKIVIQTLQDTSPPISEKVQARDDSEFWSSITNVETQQAVFEVKQAPEWLKRPCSVSFGFGLKIVSVKNANKRGIIEIKKFDATEGKLLVTEDLSAAFQSNNFQPILATRLEHQLSDNADWKLLNDLSVSGKGQFLKLVIGSEELEESEPNMDKPSNNDLDLFGNDPAIDDADFFSNLSNETPVAKKPSSAPAFIPHGPFSLPEDKNSADGKLARLLMQNKITQAVDICLQENKLQEALILALDQDDAVKEKVKNQYFHSAGPSVLSRLIHSASCHKVGDIAANADISNWKEIASSIQAYCATDSEDFNSKFIELGDRILASQNSREARNNALYCYLAGSALDKVASIWLQELPLLEQELLSTSAHDVSNLYDAHYMALNIFTQKIAVYRSILHLSGPVTGNSAESICKAIGDFAVMTSSTGNFELASHLIALLPEDFSGVKAEKERISMALRPVQQSTSAPRGRGAGLYGNGFASNQYGNAPNQYGAASNQFGVAPNQYGVAPNSANIPFTNKFAPPASNGVTPRNVSVPPKRATPRASVDHGAAYRQTSYSAAARAPAVQSSNPYAPVQATQIAPYGSQPQSQSSFQPSAGTVGGYSQPSLYGQPPSAESPLPMASKHKTDTDGWNDLPDLYKASSKPAPRRTPAPQTPQTQATADFSSPATGPPINRMGSAPPPPMTNSRSRRTSHTVQEPSVPPPKVERVNSKYAPVVTSPPPQSPHGSLGFGSMDAARTPQPVAVAPPKKNPYAPSERNNNAAAERASGPYAPPTQPNPMGVQGQNGFAPPQNNFGPPKQAPSTPAMNPYAPPNNRTPSVSVPASPAARAYTPQNNVPAVAPPVNYAPPPRAPVNPYATAPRKESNYGVPQNGPPQQAPPQNHTAAINSASTPQAPPSRYAPVANHQINAGPSPSGPPMSGPPMSGPPISGPPMSGSSMSGPQVTGPPRTSATPVHGQPRGSISSSIPARSRAASQHSIAGQPRPAPVDGGASAADAGALQLEFGELLSEMKRVAPAKYSKHVLDMEKRLNLLYSHLQKNELVSGSAVALLRQITGALKAKDYSAANKLNNEIMERHAAEVGEWNVGVKRLVTMSEAMKDQLGK